MENLAVKMGNSYPNNRRLLRALKILAPMIAGLMALGAGVRAMNAGLACPDWPLCFGRVIPHFHVGVYFEFIHRAYAGVLALFFCGCLVALLRSTVAPRAARLLAWVGLGLLGAQVIMGGLTVLKQLRVAVVTSHLMLATLWFSCVLWILFILRGRTSESAAVPLPRTFRAAIYMMPILVLSQILLGGLVAASYAGSVCVDFPLCNGVWVPTLSGPIGLQVLHRFGAYGVVISAFSLAGYVWLRRGEPWLTPEISRWSTYLAVGAFAQMCLGIANLILYIPPWMTVLHQSMAIAVLTIAYRLVWSSAGVSGWRSGEAAMNSGRSMQFL